MTENTAAGNENSRNEALKLYDILDTLPEQEFDDLTRLASEICQTPIALISLIDHSRVWYKSHVGMDVEETPRELSICTHAIQSDHLYEVEDLSVSPVFKDNPFVTATGGVRFYAGAPLVNKDGFRLGTLCVVNTIPQNLSEGQKNALSILARAVMSLMELRREKDEALLFRRALDEISMVAMLDRNQNFEYVNEKFSAHAGVAANDIIGKNRSEFALADITEEERNALFQQVASGQVYHGKVKDQNNKGEISWSNVTVLPYFNKHNEIVKMLTLRTDITNEVMMVERMQEAESLAKIGNWELNLLEGTSTWSPGMYDIMDFDAEERTGHPTLLNLVCEQDKERITQLYSDIQAGKDVLRHTDFKVVTKRNREKNIFALIRKRTNSKGKTVSVYGIMQDITSRKNAERAIRESYDKVQDLYNNAPCGYHSIDTNGVFIDINDTELRWLGYKREEVIGKLTLPDIFEGHDPASLEAFKKTGKLKDLTRLLKRKNGTIMHCLASASAIYDKDGTFLYSRTTLYDMTELKKVQDKLEESEAKYRALVEESSQMTFTTDAEGRFTYASNRLKQVIGYGDDDILGKQFAFIYDEDWRKKTIAFYIKQLSERVPETTFLFPIKNYDGEKLWVEQTAILATEEGKITGFRCVLHDVTERIKAHEAMQEATRLATHAKEMQENFLSRMSHEIRTPMNGVVGMVNLLGVSPLDEKQRVYVDGIKESAVNMLRIINDILDVTKIQAGKMVFEETDFELAHLVNNVILSLKPVADDKNVLIASHIDNKIPHTLIADPVRLNQILLNLGGNALKFTEEGSVIISVVQKELTNDNITLEFKVTDTGIGIAADKLERVFESFTQAESDTTRKYGGTGLGLTIAKQLIEQQNGTIKVKSDVGRGTTFSFTFHCKLNKGGTTTKKTEEPAHAPGTLEGRNILLVEDNIMNQKVARFTLENWGVNVTIADRGFKAVELVKMNEYDLILMDVQMPEMNGMQTTEKIRKDLKSDIPIIAMTASAMRGEREKCISVGMNDYISKPFEPEDLYKKINSFFTKNKKQENLISVPFLKKMFQDNTPFIKEILTIYITRTPTLLQEMNTSLASGNYQQLYADIHNLKNSIGLLGATDLYKSLEEIEADLLDFSPAATTLQLLTSARQQVVKTIEEAKELVETL